MKKLLSLFLILTLSAGLFCTVPVYADTISGIFSGLGLYNRWEFEDGTLHIYEMGNYWSGLYEDIYEGWAERVDSSDIEKVVFHTTGASTILYTPYTPIPVADENSARVLITQPYGCASGLLKAGASFNAEAILVADDVKLAANFPSGTEISGVTAEVDSDAAIKISNIPALADGQKLVVTLTDAKDKDGNAIENNTVVFCKAGIDNGLISARFYDFVNEEIKVTSTTIDAGTRKMVFTSTDSSNKNVELFTSGGSKLAAAKFSEGKYTVELGSALTPETSYILKRNGSEYITFTTDAGKVNVGVISGGAFDYSNPTADPAKIYAMMADNTPLCREVSIAAGGSGRFTGGTDDMFVVDGLETLKILRQAQTVNGAIPVNAAKARVNVTPFDDTRTATFTGSLGAGVHNFAVMIFKAVGTRTASDVVYVDMVTTDADGTFTLPVQFSSSMATGLYPVVMVDSNGKFYENERFAYSKKTDTETAFTLINNAAKETDAATAVYNVISANAEKLEFTYDVYDETYSDNPAKKAAYQKKAANFIAQEIQALQADGKVGFTYAEKAEAVAIFREAAIVAAISEGKIADIADVKADIPKLSVEPLSKWYDGKTDTAPLETAKWQAGINQRLNGVQFTSLDDFSDKLTAAMVFSIVENPIGTASVMEALTDFSSEITSGTVTFNPTTEITTKACQKIVDASKTYNGFDYTELINDIKAYNAANLYPENGSPDYSGNGNAVPIGPVKVDTGLTENSVPSVKTAFTDLGGYEWAVPAIEGLLEKGIVNGKAAGIFAPEDKVLREEFTKMVVLAVNPDGGGRKMAFSDVTENDWYYSYINAAYGCGIINGVSETAFGAGAFITRQDMCVIIANALEVKNKAAQASGKIEFSDSDEIADYAKEAVDMLVGLGVLNGYEDNTFRASGNATRAEAAKMIYALLEIM